MSYRHALEMVLRNHGYSSNKIFERIDQAILRLLTEFEGKLAKVAENYGGSHPFELFRFDFLFDQDLKPHLLEARPMLHSQEKPCLSLTESYSLC